MIPTVIIILISLLAVAFIVGAVASLIERYRSENTIWEHQLGLHFKDGRFLEQLPPGKHVFWGRGHTVVPFDGRRQELVVQGQDLLTSDKASVKISAVLLYRITDAERLFTSVGDPNQALHTAVQLALREIVGGEEIDRFIENKATFGKALAAHVSDTADTVGIRIDRVEIRDVILGSELKTVYTAVLRARKEALAELEKARGEAAALRTMANASRAFESHPALLQMRYLQTLEGIAQGAKGNTIVLGKPEDLLLAQVKES